MKVTLVPSHLVDGLWPRLVKGMEEACKHCDDWTPGTLWQTCRSGNAYLIVVNEGEDILMASIWQFEDRTFRCLALYGTNMRIWLRPAQEWISELARANGATKLAARGRQGWLRMFHATKNNADYEVML